MGRPLPTSTSDIIPYLLTENIYDCEENHLEDLQNLIIDEIIGNRAAVERLRNERDEAIRLERQTFRDERANSERAEAAERAALAERDRLRDALDKLIERADDSDDARYGTMSTTYVRDIARAALKGATS